MVKWENPNAVTGLLVGGGVSEGGGYGDRRHGGPDKPYAGEQAPISGVYHARNRDVCCTAPPPGPAGNSKPGSHPSGATGSAPPDIPGLKAPAWMRPKWGGGPVRELPGRQRRSISDRSLLVTCCSQFASGLWRSGDSRRSASRPRGQPHWSQNPQRRVIQEGGQERRSLQTGARDQEAGRPCTPR